MRARRIGRRGVGLATALTVLSGAWAGAAGGEGATLRDCERCPELVVVAAGEFVMGDDSALGAAPERPAHRVVIHEPFAVSRRTVSAGAWKDCVLGGLCQGHRGGSIASRHEPIGSVSWIDVQQYLAWLSIESGFEYRLPSEAEWEYLARRDAGVEIGAGLEWTSDCWHDDYQRAPSDGRSWDWDGDCRFHVVRGARDGASERRVTTRYRFLFNATDPSLGFRVARKISH